MDKSPPSFTSDEDPAGGHPLTGRMYVEVMRKFIALFLFLAWPALSASRAGSLREALTLFNSGKYVEAFHISSQYWQENPQSVDALKILGMSQFMLGHPAEALAAMVRATELAPNDPDAFYYLGRLYFSADNATAALAAFERTTALDPSSVRGFNNLGQTYEALGQRPEAEKAYKKAIVLESNLVKKSEWPEYNLGALYLGDGRTEEAIPCFRRALQINPTFPEARIKLAVALSKKQPVPESFDLLQETLRVDPHNAEAHYRLALLLSKTGKPDEAREHFTLFEKYRKQ